jgi:hypothetical protein
LWEVRQCVFWPVIALQFLSGLAVQFAVPPVLLTIDARRVSFPPSVSTPQLLSWNRERCSNSSSCRSLPLPPRSLLSGGPRPGRLVRRVGAQPPTTLTAAPDLGGHCFASASPASTDGATGKRCWPAGVPTPQLSLDLTCGGLRLPQLLPPPGDYVSANQFSSMCNVINSLI